jgi:hypothetical protein
MRPPRQLRLWVALATLVGAGAARADDVSDRAAAEAVFAEGASAFEAGDYAAACPKFESAVTLAGPDALGGRLLLAECWERTGRMASAWATYREVAARAAVMGQSERAQIASDAVERVTPELAYVELSLAAGVDQTPGLEIVRDGSPIPPASWSVRLPVDPGTLAFEVRAPGKRPRQHVVVVAPRATATLAVEPLEDVVTRPPPEPTPAPVAAPAAAPDEPTRDGSGQRVAGVILGGAGLLALGAGAVMGLVAKGQYDDAYATERCSSTDGALLCDDATALDSPRGLGDAATVVFVTGGVLAAAGVVVFLTAPSNDAPSARLRIGPSASGAFAALEGRGW